MVLRRVFGDRAVRCLPTYWKVWHSELATYCMNDRLNEGT